VKGLFYFCKFVYLILIIHTTEYREGSDMFARAAFTLEKELLSEGKQVLSKGILHKKELISIFDEIAASGKKIDAYHFIGHSGMYGPMYGTRQYPEQFSPFEIKNLKIPFAAGAKAYFHCCRSARWFAAFFANNHGVETFGYYWYTTVTANKERFRKVTGVDQPVYTVGCKGKKSHGLLGSVKKYTALEPLEKMRSFLPADFAKDRSYDKVAALYDQVFRDIKVRKDEWNWLMTHIPGNKKLTVLDIGCGNGALLKELSPKINCGIGVDISTNILDKAKLLNKDNKNLDFRLLNGPILPVEDHSADVVTSLLSFRYLDWDPLMNEIKRVLKPGGKVLIIDMVTVPVKKKEIPRFLVHKAKQLTRKFSNKEFNRNLKKLVTDPDWKYMLQYNPIRAEHEMKWYLESRFPGKKVEKINIGYHSCMLAFDSGNIEDMNEIYLTYP
jgi:ubiquinone/menaquinone biosynthesis C-methylase UbiE